jgi:hypothetical protein
MPLAPAQMQGAASWVAVFGAWWVSFAMVASGLIGNMVVGALVAAVACAIGASALSSFAEPTPAGLVYRHNLRRRVIPWVSIAPGHGQPMWLSGGGAGLFASQASWAGGRSSSK